MNGLDLYYKQLPKIFSFLSYLRLYSNQWKSLSQLKSIQLKKLRKLIDYSRKNVPFYQKLFGKMTFNPNFVNTLEDIKNFPIIRKKDLIRNYSYFISRQINPITCLKDMTSGSTGEPTTFLYDKDYQIFNYAIEFRRFFAIGIRPQHKHVTIVDDEYIPKIDSFRKHLYYSTVFLLSVFEDPSIIIQKLQRLNPQIIHGPPSMMEEIARYVEENGIKNITPKKILCTNEVLDSKAREKIEQTFNVKVFESYGCTEIPHIAWECKNHSGLHINMDNVMVEILKNGMECGPHEIGQIVVTAFNNKVIPLIRYDLGDLGAFSDESCPCGRKFPLLERVYGRTFDLLHLLNGKILHPWILINALKQVPTIKQFQIIQEKEDFFLIKIVGTLDFSYSDESKLISIGQSIVGNEISFKIIKVSKIERGPEGKYHTVISKLSSRG